MLFAGSSPSEKNRGPFKLPAALNVAARGCGLLIRRRALHLRHVRIRGFSWYQDLGGTPSTLSSAEMPGAAHAQAAGVTFGCT